MNLHTDPCCSESVYRINIYSNAKNAKKLYSGLKINQKKRKAIQTTLKRTNRVKRQMWKYLVPKTRYRTRRLSAYKIHAEMKIRYATG
jgi:hypothetical protein